MKEVMIQEFESKLRQMLEKMCENSWNSSYLNQEQ